MNLAFTSTEFSSFFRFRVTFLPIVIFKLGGAIIFPQNVQWISFRFRSIALRNCEARSYPSQYQHSSSSLSFTSSTLIELICSFSICFSISSGFFFSSAKSFEAFCNPSGSDFLAFYQSLNFVYSIFIMFMASGIQALSLTRRAPSMSQSDLKVRFRNQYQ